MGLVGFGQGGFGAVVEFLGVPDGGILFEELEEFFQDRPGGWGRARFGLPVRLVDNFRGSSFAVHWRLPEI